MGAQFFVELGNFTRPLAGGEDNLFAGVKQRFKGKRQFELGALLAAEKVNVLQQQNVALLPVAFLELVDFVAAQRLDHFVGEVLGRDVIGPLLGIFGQYMVTHRLGEMAFCPYR